MGGERTRIPAFSVMRDQPDYIVELRSEPEFAGRWGLRSWRTDQWLPVVYASEREASAVVDAIRLSKRLPGDLPQQVVQD